jgi:hypothetical protein
VNQDSRDWTRGWEREHLWDSPDATLRVEGVPVRVVNDQPAPQGWRRRPVGFGAVSQPIMAIFRQAGHR